MIVVSDTSVITNLWQIGHVNILSGVYGKIFIPQAVFEELSVLEDQRQAIIQFAWMEIRPVQNHKIVTELSQLLDVGESEA